MSFELKPSDLRQELLAEGVVVLIDVRSPSEFASGHIAGAINMPLPELAMRGVEIPEGRLVLICERGARAQAARSALLPRFPGALVLEGGMHSWRCAGYPLIQVTKTAWSLERQVRLAAGSLVLIGVALGLAYGPLWTLVAALPGAGLVLAGMTELCPMAGILIRMPWNQIRLPQPTLRKGEATAE
jgi:rhodanese-related sulfurtransferase